MPKATSAPNRLNLINSAITSIAIRKANRLHIKRESIIFCHCECDLSHEAIHTNKIRTKCESLQKFLLRFFAFAKSRVSLLSRHCETNRRFTQNNKNRLLRATSRTRNDKANTIVIARRFSESPKQSKQIKMNFATFANAKSRNDSVGYNYLKVFATYLVIARQCKQSEHNEAIHKNKYIDCFDFLRKSRNDGLCFPPLAITNYYNDKLECIAVICGGLRWFFYSALFDYLADEFFCFAKAISVS